MWGVSGGLRGERGAQCGEFSGAVRGLDILGMNKKRHLSGHYTTTRRCHGTSQWHDRRCLCTSPRGRQSVGMTTNSTADSLFRARDGRPRSCDLTSDLLLTDVK
jgi:hypothetical protein